MTVASLIKDFVLVGLLPAVGFGAAALTFVKYYADAVTQNLRNIEEALRSHAESNDELPGTMRGWSQAFYRAHLYYTIHAKCFTVPLLGGLAWIAAYAAETVSMWQFFFGGSPFGIPSGTGIRIIAVAAWIIWLFFVIVIINRFGIRPEQNVVQSPQELLEEKKEIPGKET